MTYKLTEYHRCVMYLKTSILKYSLKKEKYQRNLFKIEMFKTNCPISKTIRSDKQKSHDNEVFKYNRQP